MATSNEPKAPTDKTPTGATTSDTTTSSRRSETTARTASGSSVRGARTGGQDSNPGAGVADQLRESFEARTTVPGADNVDARLDNRRGADRPKLEEWPAVPQQVDGPDVMHQAEHTRKVLQDRDDAVDMGERKGMFSPGPHGLSDETLREGGPVGQEQTLYGTESLSEDEVAQGSPKADG